MDCNHGPSKEYQQDSPDSARRRPVPLCLALAICAAGGARFAASFRRPTRSVTRNMRRRSAERVGNPPGRGTDEHGSYFAIDEFMTTRDLGGYTRGRAPTPLAILALLLFAALPFACSSSQQEGAHATQSGLSAPSLGGAASFRVLGGSTVTNTGPTTIFGDLGVAPGSAITGFPPGLVSGGAVHAGDATALRAQNDVTTAYTVLAGAPCTRDLTGKDLGGLTLTQGVYCFSSEAQLTGTLTLDAQGDPSAVFIFKIGSKLTTAHSASVVFINGGQDCDAFWQIGSSATLGTDTVFAGSILALTSIALETRASVSGRALARNGAVTMDTNHIFGGICGAAGSDAGVDGTVTESGGGDAEVDTSVAESDGSHAGVDASGTESDGSHPGVDAGVAESGGNDAGGSLCCGVLCGTSCTNLNGDIANCGSCGHACASGEFCGGGACLPCGSVCGGACVDLVTDGKNCGSCGHSCAPGESCKGSACVACATLCGGACVDLVNDGNNCGSCGHSCAPSESCKSGACVTCSTLCGGACVDLVNDGNNCGSCGQVCAPGESCKSGSCTCQ